MKIQMSLLRPVLLAEDDNDAAVLFRCAFEKADIPHPLIHVSNGQEVIRYLAGDPPYAEHSLPCLLVLDLKMPLMDGFDVLAFLRSYAAFNGLPRVILSSSDQPGDIELACKLGAYEYCVKSPDFDGLITTIQQLHRRWVSPGPTLGTTQVRAVQPKGAIP